MKKILLSLLLSTIILTAFSQPISNRSSGAVTTQDARWSALYNMLLPKYDDTTQANLPQYIGLDSCGAAIFTRSDNNFWIKQCNPKKWVLVSGGGGSGTVTSVATTNGYAMLSSVSNPTLAANILLAVDSAALSVKYLRRADSTLYVTQKKLNDTATAIRADIASSSTTLPEAYANGSRFTTSATMNMAGNSHTIDSATNINNYALDSFKVKSGGIKGISIYDNDAESYGNIYFGDGSNFYMKAASGSLFGIQNTQQNFTKIITADTTVADQIYTLPKLINPLNYLPVSVNGSFADAYGNINISSGGVTNVSRTNGYGITASVSNPTTTPDITIAVDSSTLSAKYVRRVDSVAGGYYPYSTNPKNYLTTAVTSVATGLGLSGGAITSTGTLLLDTASASVISRQRAAATYQPLSTTWLLTGNSGTTTGANYLGTSGNNGLRIRTNNTTALYIDSLQNLGIGTTSITNYGSGYATLAIGGTTKLGLIDMINTTGTHGLLQNDVGSGGFVMQTTSTVNIAFRPNNATAMTVASGGNVGIGQTTPTAYLHFKAGTATASTAPIKLTSGTNLTTAETGAIEYNGTNLFFTRTGTTRESVITANSVNTVSPTSPNRTITVVIDGVTYYISAKTSND